MTSSEDERIRHDAEFHMTVAAASGNATLASMLNAVSSRTMRVRAWRGLIEEGAGARTVAQHQDILHALEAHDPDRASAAALVHVATTEAWFRQAVEGWHSGDGDAIHPAPDDDGVPQPRRRRRP